MYAKSLIVLSMILFAGCASDKPYHQDPLAKNQWYLDANDKNYTNIHLHVTWMKGRGVLVAVVDNGIDIFHEDLRDNIGKGSYNYMPPDYNFSVADHGTCCAGIIAGVEGNGKGIRGVAPEAKIIGYNALKVPSISNISDAFVRHKERVWISSNSWGDFNSWGEPLALKSLEEAALKDGVTKGRNGRGIIYVFSAGNGSAKDNALPTDNVNYSGLVNNRYTIPVGAVDEHGKKAPYSEIGATLTVVAPSKATADGPGIVTTDATNGIGYNPKVFANDYNDTNYTKNFSGTSASAPMVSGVVALMLEANPKLGWRDVRAILAKSASKNDSDDSDWTTNGAGYHINHRYGFGLVDACKAIGLAFDWHNFPKEIKVEKSKKVNKKIPDNDTIGVESNISITDDLIVEFVDIYLDAHDHDSLGDLEVVLVSPDGTKSVLAQKHAEMFDGYFRYNNWRFGSMRHLGEHSKGTWKLQIRDLQSDHEGALFSWKIRIYGHKPNVNP